MPLIQLALGSLYHSLENEAFDNISSQFHGCSGTFFFLVFHDKARTWTHNNPVKALIMPSHALTLYLLQGNHNSKKTPLSSELHHCPLFTKL